MYIAGDYNVICDRCGFKKKRSECRKTWDGLLVCADTCWEPRHPQDFVRGRKDRQRVPDPRPDTQTMFNETTIKTGASEGDSSIDVNSISGISDGDSIGINLDKDTVQWTVVSGIPAGDTVPLHQVLDGGAAAGSVVYIPGDGFLATNEVTQDDL